MPAWRCHSPIPRPCNSTSGSPSKSPRARTPCSCDRAARRIASDLEWPKNITPILLPSRSPELNPGENVWQFLRANFLSNRVIDTYDDI
ncbi:MAG: transposase, partial [Aestuariivirga sp.]|nr:transposase [Aestuariivirga sp.]